MTHDQTRGLILLIPILTILGFLWWHWVGKVAEWLRKKLGIKRKGEG